jgi:DNA helicase-2/ATP-dependent DNA helicase PcrA
MTNTGTADLLKDLNPDQVTATTTFDTPLLVLAGSGTGKTEILTRKFECAIRRGVKPERIMAVTFTKRAAKEARDRIERRLGPDVDPASLWIGTFHALSTRILRQSPTMSPIGAEFTTMEDSDIDVVIAQALRKISHPSINVPDQLKRKIRSLKNEIDRRKNLGDDVMAEDMVRHYDRETLGLIRTYQGFLKERNNADFGDLIVSVIKMMENPVARQAWANRFDVMLVDEYQDVNTGQGRWIDALKGDNTHLTCFGDDDQVIYQWRGADPSYIREFGQRYHGATALTLRTNYRSPGPIVEAATRLIRNNTLRFDKDVTSAHENQGDVGSAINVHAHDYQARHTHLIGVMQAESIGFEWDQMMVLTRANAEAAEIATKLHEAGIPANLIKPGANDVPLMRTLCAWLRLIRNPHDCGAAAIVLDADEQDPVYQNLWTRSMMRGQSFMAAVSEQIEQGRLKTPAYVDLHDRYKAVMAAIVGLTPIDALHTVFETAGLSQELARYPEADRLHFIALFQNLCADGVDLDHFSGFEDLIQNQIPNRAKGRGVMVSTMHGVKGLEAPIVFATSWSAKVFPRSMTDNDIEEQRRLAFVTITRAMTRVHLFYDRSKGVSPFIKELGI